MVKFPHTMVMILLVTVVLSGCSWFGKDDPEYLDSPEGVALKIPEGLDTPAGHRPVVISILDMRLPAGEELKPLPPRVVSTSGTRDSNTYMGWSAEGVYLFVKDTPESVTRRLRFAIERSGMNLQQKSEVGAHQFEYYHVRINEEGFFKRMLFWRDGPPDYSGTYVTGLTAEGENTRVYLYYTDGKSCDTPTSEHVLGVFMARLG